MPKALSSSETCASPMALSCAFDEADDASPLSPRKSVCAETLRLSPDASVVTVTWKRPLAAPLNQLAYALLSKSAAGPAIVTQNVTRNPNLVPGE